MINKRFWLAIVFTVLNLDKVFCKCILKNNSISCEETIELPRDIANIRGGDLGSVTRINIENKITGKSKNELPINVNAFHLTTNLKKLWIVNYSVRRLFPDTFHNIAVESIFLNYDDIDHIYQGTFTNISTLRKIHLNNNLLEVIPSGMISNLPELTDLSLSHNHINYIEVSALEELPNLRKLCLDNNKFHSIFVHQTISYPEKLEILWLHNNSITSLTNFMLYRLTKLKLLNLGFNRISFIEPNSFEHTPNLQTLVLTHNGLKTVDGNIFPRKGMTSLRNLYLDNNYLMFLSSSFFFRLSDLKKITLVGNPWLCPCLNEIERILYENGILQQCQSVYTRGEKPVCVAEEDTINCHYKYNDLLSEKYINYINAYPVHIRPTDCIL